VSDDSRRLNVEAREKVVYRVCISLLSSSECRQDAATALRYRLHASPNPYVRTRVLPVFRLVSLSKLSRFTKQDARINDDAVFSRVAIAEIVRRVCKLISIREIQCASISFIKAKTSSFRFHVAKDIFINTTFSDS